MKRKQVLPILGCMVLVAIIPASAHATRGPVLLTAPQALALPASAWPTDTAMEDGRVINAADADTGLLLLSATVSRTLTYTAAGMTSGYFQRYAHRDPSVGNVLAYWMPSLYSTSSQAETMVELGKQAIGQHATPAVSEACPPELPANCTVFVTTSSNNSIRVGYAVWSLDNVLAEASLVAYAGTSSFPLDIFQSEFTTLIVAANTSTNAAVFPAPTATETPRPTKTAQSVRATAVPTSTRTGAATVTTTPKTLVTATPTAVPLFVSVRAQHPTLKAGSEQTIRVRTLPRARLVMIVTFPDRVTKQHQETAGLLGAAVWSFRQPFGHTIGSGRTAQVVVTARAGSQPPVVSRTHYSIR